MRWNDTEKLKLLRTAILYNPNFKINAKQVVEAWICDDDEDRPSARTVSERFNEIMKHAQDLDTIRKVKQEQAKVKDEANAGGVKNEDVIKDESDFTLAARTTPAKPSSTSRATTTKPASRASAKPTRSTTNKKCRAGIKRKRGSRDDSEGVDVSSVSETSSGSDADLDTPTQNMRKTLPPRATRRAPSFYAAGFDSDGTDAGLKDYGSYGSDVEYDLAEERKKKAAAAAKKHKLARK